MQVGSVYFLNKYLSLSMRWKHTDDIDFNVGFMAPYLLSVQNSFSILFSKMPLWYFGWPPLISVFVFRCDGKLGNLYI